MVQPLHVGNALRLFIQPTAGAVRWRVLRKGADTFVDENDPAAFVAYEGNELVVVDNSFLVNEQMAFYRPYYTVNGTTWTAGPTASGTPVASYEEHSTDVLGLVRDRLETGLKVECDRGTFTPELGYIQVYTAPPSMEQDLRFPLVTISMETEDPAERGIGEVISGDEFDSIGFEWDESEGWLARVQLSIVGWSLNSDERIELRNAIRRLVIANLPVFADKGMDQVSLSLSDVDAVSGEYNAAMYQVIGNFSCIAPVRVSGKTPAIREVISRSINDG